MTTAKPEYDDQVDPSEDLIAELARMMAGDAEADRAEPPSRPAPQIVRNPAPVQPQSVQPQSQQAPAQPEQPSTSMPRLPGMESGVAAGPVSRVPGLARVAEEENSQPAQARQRPAFDFGRAPTATPVIVPDSLDSWQSFKSPAVETGAPSFQDHAEKEEPSFFEDTEEASGFDFQPQERNEVDDGAGDHDASPRVASIEDLIEANLADTLDAEFHAPADEQKALQAESYAVEPEEYTLEEFTDEPVSPEVPGPAPTAPEPAAARPAPFNLPRSSQATSPLLRPMQFNEPAPQGDDFAVSPVFGLGARQTEQRVEESAYQAPQTQPSFQTGHDEPSVSDAGKPQMPRHEPIAPAMAAIAPESKVDPLDEIESMFDDIGRPAGRAAPADVIPEVRPALNPFAPQRTSIDIGRSEPELRGEPNLSNPISAEDAILAAARANGAKIGRVEFSMAAEEPEVEKRAFWQRWKKEKPAPAEEPDLNFAAPAAPVAAAAAEPEIERSRGSFRKFVGPAVAGTLLVVAGLALYWVLGMGGSSTGENAPVLSADTSAVKEAPPAADTTANTASGSVVFNEMDGNSQAAAETEQLVSRDQTADEDVASTDATTGSGSNDMSLANRKVRTVTVRPDGTIVSSDSEVLAGAQQLPVDRPNVPDVPSTTSAAATQMLDNAETVGTTPTSFQATDPVPATTATPAGDITNAPIPRPRPSFRNSSATQQQVTPASAAPVATASAGGTGGGPVDLMASASSRSQSPDTTSVATASAPTTSSGAAAYVQLSSQRSEAEAQAAAANVQRRFANLLGGAQLEIRQADLGERGIYYRVLLPASSTQAAIQTCTNIKAGGGDCFVPGN